MSTPEPPPPPGDSSPDGSGLPSYGSVPPPPDPPGGSSGSAPSPPPPAPPTSSSAQAFSPAEAIAWGWRKFTENVGAAILAAVIILGATFICVFVFMAFSGRMSATTPASEFPFQPSGPGDLLSQGIFTLVILTLTGVAAKAALDVADNSSFDFFAAFGKSNVVQLIFAAVLLTLVQLLITLALPTFLELVLGWAVGFLTYFTVFAIADGRPAPDAIKHSVQLVSANFGNALLLAILSALVIFAGFIALCVGVIVAYPVTLLASAYAYRAFNGQPIAQ